MKIYNTEGTLKEWFTEHQFILFDDILKACEEGLYEENEDIIVATIHTVYGVTVLALPMFDDIITSLQKCEAAYVAAEEFEKAARARDCQNDWVERKIYKEKP
jgi:hypothetical protein